MSIISLNEKRTSINTTHTTGREKSYFVSDRFPSTFAKITGKIFAFGSDSAFGGFGAFWENTDGTLVDLEMEIGTFSAVNEQSSRINTSESESWYDLEIDLQNASDGRIIFYGRKGTDFRTDVDLDDIKLVSSGGTEVNFDPTTQMSKWQRSQALSFNSYSTAKSNYSSATFSDMSSSTSNNHVQWNYVTGAGGTSGGTGSDNAADNSSTTGYVYFEASSNSSDYNKGSYLRLKNNYNLTTGAEI